MDELTLKMMENIDLTKEAPTKEPERQYYFMAKAGQYVKKRSEALGRPLSCATVTFGCQMNPENEICKNRIK